MKVKNGKATTEVGGSREEGLETTREGREQGRRNERGILVEISQYGSIDGTELHAAPNKGKSVQRCTK